MMDYLELLTKYMKHVGRECGSVYIPWEQDGFTQEEIDTLETIDRKILSETKEQ